MENEIKVNEYIRTKRGIIDRVAKISDNYIFLKSKFFITEYGESSTFIKKTDVVKHSPNLIDLIQCGDYVNGYKVTNVINKEPCPSGKCIDIDADRPSEYCTLWEDNIETVVTKEQFKSITYKVTKM